MPNVTDAKQSLVLHMSAAGLTHLDALAERYGLRRTGIVLTAVRVCSMAHGCGNAGTLFIREHGGDINPATLGSCLPVRDSVDLRQVVLMCSPHERAKLTCCSRRAGGLAQGIETALKFLRDVSSIDGLNLFEKRGSVFYPVFQSGWGTR